MLSQVSVVCVQGVFDSKTSQFIKPPLYRALGTASGVETLCLALFCVHLAKPEPHFSEFLSLYIPGKCWLQEKCVWCLEDAHQP